MSGEGVVDIVLPVLTPEVAARMLVELVKHVLYMRQQIPSLYGDVALDVATKGTKSNRKAGKFVEQFERLRQTLTSFVHTHYPSEVVLSLGASLISPKELYTISFAPPSPAHPAAAFTERQVSDWIRGMILSCVVADVPPQDSLGPTKITVLVQNRPGVPLPAWPEGILPKQGFAVKAHKLKGAVVFRTATDPAPDPRDTYDPDTLMDETCARANETDAGETCARAGGTGACADDIGARAGETDARRDAGGSSNAMQGEWGQVCCALSGWK